MKKMIRVKKPLARKMYYSGHTITVVPCKCGVDNEVAKVELSMFCGDTDPLTLANRFDTTVRLFEWHNCNAELGYYAHYYITEEAMEQYNICQSMCSASL